MKTGFQGLQLQSIWISCMETVCVRFMWPVNMDPGGVHTYFPLTVQMLNHHSLQSIKLNQ